MATDSFIQLTTDGAGKKLDTAIFNMGAGSTELHREKLIIADPLSTGGFATVTSSAGLSTVVTSGLVSITSGTVTLSSASSLSSGTVTLSSAPLVIVASSGGTQLVQSTAATNPWSSAPGFNMPVVTVSSGLVQVSGTITSASSGIIQLSSAPLVIVASSGGTQLVQSTAGTNPWSSAPGFNMPVVSVSSGLIQVLTSGTLVVVNTSSGLVQISGTVGLSTAAAANLVQIVTSSAGSLVATTSQGLQVQQSTSKIVPVLQASSGVTSIDLLIGTSGFAPAVIVGTTITKVSSSPGLLFHFTCFTTALQGAVARLYNATTSNVAQGSTNAIMLKMAGSLSSAAGGQILAEPWMPFLGAQFGTACSFDVVLTATSTTGGGAAGNYFVTAIYSTK